MFCKECGTKNDDGARFCELCGAPMKAQANEAEQTVLMQENVYTPQINTYAQIPFDNFGAPVQAKSSKKWIIILVVGIVILVVGGFFIYQIFGNDGNEYETLLTDAQQYLAKNDKKNAETTYLKAIEKASNPDDAYIALSDIYVEQGKIDEAILLLEKGIGETKSQVLSAKLDRVKKTAEKGTTNEADAKDSDSIKIEGKDKTKDETKDADLINAENVLRQDKWEAKLLFTSKYTVKCAFGDCLFVSGITEDGNEKFGMTDKKGNIVIPLMYEGIGSAGKDGLFSVVTLTDGDIEYEQYHFGVVDEKNQVIIKAEYDDYITFKDGYATGRKIENNPEGFYTVLDENGKETAASNKYTRLSTLSNGAMLAGNKSLETALIDCNDNIISDFGKYDFTWEYTDNGLFIARKDGKDCVVNNKGEIAFTTSTDSVKLFGSEISPHHFFITNDGNKDGIIDDKGKVVVPNKYDFIDDPDIIPNQEPIFSAVEEAKEGEVYSQYNEIVKSDGTVIMRKKLRGFTEGKYTIGKNCLYSIESTPKAGGADNYWDFCDLSGNTIKDPIYEHGINSMNLTKIVPELGGKIEGKILDINTLYGHTYGYFDGITMRMTSKEQGSATVDLIDNKGDVLVPNLDYQIFRDNIIMDENYLYATAYDMTSLDKDTLNRMVYGQGDIDSEEQKEFWSQVRYNVYSIRYN